MGSAIFILDDDRGASRVIFGEEGDSVLLGMLSLESLGIMRDPVKRTLRPLPMVLGAVFSNAGHHVRRSSQF